MDEIDLTGVPAHIGVVMDGNGRWAQKRGLARTEGHAAGEEALFDAVEGALDLGVKAAGSIRHLETVMQMLAAGADRIGTSATATIAEEWAKR